ncbi:MAG: 30S ribosome-binding factor RbfA [Rhodospirillaceae bacterium]
MSKSAVRGGGKAPSQRQLRVGEEIRHVLAGIFERGDLYDPDLRGIPLTVGEVRLGPDLRNATVYVMRLGGGDMGTVLAALKRLRPHLRHELARSVRLKYVPDLQFAEDTTYAKADALSALLDRPEVARDLTAEADDAEVFEKEGSPSLGANGPGRSGDHGA